MVGSSTHTTNVRLLLPETLWLEPEHFERAREMSDRLHSEEQQWQVYLNTLAMLVFKAWLKERLTRNDLVQLDSALSTEACYLSVGGFKICLLSTEHVLDEIVRVPKRAIEQPELAAHFYVVLEVLEEQEQAIIRGFLPYSELAAIHASQSGDSCVLPLSALDHEIDHLMGYVQYLDPSVVGVPRVATQVNTSPVRQERSELKTYLSQWLQGILDEGWQTIDALINSEANLAWSTRNATSGAKGGKLINFAMQLGDQAVVLLVTVTPESEEKTGINVQVLPARGVQFLPDGLKLTLLSKTDKILQEVQSREQDNYIQLKPFRGKPGADFSIEVSLNNIRVREAFEL